MCNKCDIGTFISGFAHLFLLLLKVLQPTSHYLMVRDVQTLVEEEAEFVEETRKNTIEMMITPVEKKDHLKPTEGTQQFLK